MSSLIVRLVPMFKSSICGQVYVEKKCIFCAGVKSYFSAIYSALPNIVYKTEYFFFVQFR